MNFTNLSHLLSISKAYSARIRVLEMQVAQFGLHCPAHIQADLDSTRLQLAEIEQNIASCTSATVTTTHPIRSSLFSNVVYIAVILAVVGIVSGLILPRLISRDIKPFEQDYHNADYGEGKPVGYTDMPPDSTPNYDTLSVVCATEALLVEGVPGALRVRNTRLDQISLQQMPIGSRLMLECASQDLGHIMLVIVRHSMTVGHKEEIAWVIEFYQLKR